MKTPSFATLHHFAETEPCLSSTSASLPFLKEETFLETRVRVRSSTRAERLHWLQSAFSERFCDEDCLSLGSVSTHPLEGQYSHEYCESKNNIQVIVLQVLNATFWLGTGLREQGSDDHPREAAASGWIPSQSFFLP